MKQTPAELLKHSSHMFTRQSPMVSLWQTLADNFYPERADFTTTRNVGNDLADQLIDSYPILARRDMGNSLSAMLRDGEWFKMTTDQVNVDQDAKGWMDWATTKMRRYLDDRASAFTRATKEGDHDYVTFGQAVISVELNKMRTGLLFRCWHLRDCAWAEDESGQVCTLYRRWKPTNYQLLRTFGEKRLHADVVRAARENPHSEVDCLHVVMPAEQYGDEQIAARFKYVSIQMDCVRQEIIEVVGVNHMGYVVPRFQTVAGSQYAYSPATVCALPDARLIQAMTHTLLEAGERFARPPLIATSKVVRSDVDLSPDGITWVDQEYDERTGDALRPLQTQNGGYPIGLELRADIKETIASAFFLNKISLPPVDGGRMTAYEVQERMKQFRRENLPLFAPIEAEYNGQLCEISFNLLFENGLLGSKFDVPQSLMGQNVLFKFKSPLSAAEEELKSNRFSQMRAILAETATLDPSVVDNADIDTAMRDAIEGLGGPTNWLFPVEQVMQRKQQRAELQAETTVAQAGAA